MHMATFGRSCLIGLTAVATGYFTRNSRTAVRIVATIAAVVTWSAIAASNLFEGRGSQQPAIEKSPETEPDKVEVSANERRPGDPEAN